MRFRCLPFPDGSCCQTVCLWDTAHYLAIQNLDFLPLHQSSCNQTFCLRSCKRGYLFAQSQGARLHEPSEEDPLREHLRNLDFLCLSDGYSCRCQFRQECELSGSVCHRQKINQLMPPMYLVEADRISAAFRSWPFCW